MATMLLKRGDVRTLTVSGLVDGNQAPAVFGVNDVLIWTAKRKFTDVDADALFQKNSQNVGEILINTGSDTAVITLNPDDFPAGPIAKAIPFQWDLEYWPGGDDNLTTTLVSGDGSITPDVTLV